MKSKLVVWGAGGHAKVVNDIVQLQCLFEIVGFIDNANHERKGTKFCGSHVLGGGECLESLLQEGIDHIFIAVGDCAARLHLAQLAQEKGFHLVSTFHPNAVIAQDATIGEGSVVMAGAVINPGVQIGKNVIINTCASIDHDCCIEDGVHISPGARLGGQVSVGVSSWVGIGATIRDKIRIGERVTIGAGSVVVDNIPHGVLAYGVPAKTSRKTIYNELQSESQ